MQDPHVKGSPKGGLWGATLGFFVGFAAVALFGPTARSFRDAMGLDPQMVGWLVAMPALSGSILRIPFSAWVDTTGGRKPFLVLLSLSVLGMLGLTFLIQFWYPDHLGRELFWVVAALGVLCGCGIATFSVGISQVSYWFPQREQGWALGTYAGVGNLAPGIFSFLLPLVLTHWGLSSAYWLWSCFLLAGTALYFQTGRNAPYFQLREAGLSAAEARERAKALGQELFPSGSMRESLVRSARVWQTWALVGVYFTTFGGFIALTAWFPTYWGQFFDAAAVTAGAWTATYSILASAIRVPGGFLADRIGGERTAVFALTVTLVGAVILSWTHAYGWAVCGLLLMGAGMGITNAAVFKLVPQEVPEAVGGAAGWVGGLGAFGGFAIPPVMGWAVEHWGSGGYARGFVTFVVLTLLSLGLIGLLALHRRRTS
ncbi:MAG: nitrate/nitrite transporter [Acidobacteriota bacterium]